MARIILAAGGTGGHIFPALAVGEILEKAGHEVILFTDKRGAPMVEGAVSYRVISGASPFNAGIMRKLAGLSQLAIGVVQSLGAMAFNRPASVIGFGGYPSFAPLFAARALRVPIILHEQNAVMGRANRLRDNICKYLRAQRAANHCDMACLVCLIRRAIKKRISYRQARHRNSLIFWRASRLIKAQRNM